MRGDGADAGDFVGGDGDAEAGAADEDGAVGVSGCDLGEVSLVQFGWLGMGDGERARDEPF